MALAEWFWKHYNNDVTGVGKRPLRTHIGSKLKKFRDTRAGEKKLAGVKKRQDVVGIEPNTRTIIMVD